MLGALVLGAGKRVIPPLLNLVARTRSRELFTLCVLAIALGDCDRGDSISASRSRWGVPGGHGRRADRGEPSSGRRRLADA